MLINALTTLTPLVRTAYAASSSDDAVGAGVGLTMMLVYCCIMIVPLVIWGAVTYWVYTDAQKSNVDSPVLWALLTFFLGVIGLILYFFVAKNKTK